MKEYISKFLLSILMVLCLSCNLTKYKYVEIQVLNPGDTMLPPNTTKLHILSKPKNGVTVFDTALVHWFRESPSFTNLSLIIQNEKQFLNEMKRHSGEGHVLLVPSFHFVNYERFSETYDIISGEDNSDAPNVTSYIEGYYYILTIAVKVDIYQVKNFSLYDSYTDTLSVQLWQNNRAKLYTDSLQLDAAFRYASHIASYWTSEARLVYYNSDTCMQKGLDYFNNNNLEGAIYAWEDAYENGKTMTRALAANNIGLAYEMLDDLDNCEKWLSKSRDLRKIVAVKNYLNIIKERKFASKKLNKIFNN